MAASWVSPVSRNPPILSVAIARTRHTYNYIVKHREFAICILPSDLVKKIHFLGTVSGREVRDKIATAGLTKTRARKIGCPVIEESIAVLECKLFTTILAGDHDLVLGEVIEAYAKEGIEPPNPAKYPIPMHVGGDRYTTPSTNVIEVKQIHHQRTS